MASAQRTLEPELAETIEAPRRPLLGSSLSMSSTGSSMSTESCRRINIKDATITVGEPFTLYQFQVAVCAPALVALATDPLPRKTVYVVMQTPCHARLCMLSCV